MEKPTGRTSSEVNRFPVARLGGLVLARGGILPGCGGAAEGRCAWWQRYQLQDFRVIDHWDGNKEPFMAAIEALKAKGVRTYADVVVNQMAHERSAATTLPGDDTLSQTETYKSYWRRQILDGLISPQDFQLAAASATTATKPLWCAIGSAEGCGSRSAGPEGEGPHTKLVNDQRRQYIQALYDLGARGFGIDAAKHMPNGAIKYFVSKEVVENAHGFAETITSAGAT